MLIATGLNILLALTKRSYFFCLTLARVIRTPVNNDNGDFSLTQVETLLYKVTIYFTGYSRSFSL